jgi:redox-sensitive bicupin YhaK (pirin superfamily)
MLELRKATDRGVANFGWLDSRHTFSFGHYSRSEAGRLLRPAGDQ